MNLLERSAAEEMGRGGRGRALVPLLARAGEPVHAYLRGIPEIVASNLASKHALRQSRMLYDDIRMLEHEFYAP